MFEYFFFSSRRRHTRSLCDWSSDVCSSDLVAVAVWYFGKTIHELYEKIQAALATLTARVQENLAGVRIVRAYAQEERSEERRVGKECRYRRVGCHEKQD